ncbi:hypothetical protein J5X92_12870 [Alteromonas sp. K632G]|jgi:hypothetical protein|uniref:hypothetical protein n=1 Tax=unclassified Alteromonas TaxID=2614992 RepID=UPI00163B8E89|nr:MULTISPECIES: hypothetical protein [unclassified Alteromonas]MBO7923114.1 hypothetical protein [Alteromonas sp. K632G]
MDAMAERPWMGLPRVCVSPLPPDLNVLDVHLDMQSAAVNKPSTIAFNNERDDKSSAF